MNRKFHFWQVSRGAQHRPFLPALPRGHAQGREALERLPHPRGLPQAGGLGVLWGGGGRHPGTRELSLYIILDFDILVIRFFLDIVFL